MLVKGTEVVAHGHKHMLSIYTAHGSIPWTKQKQVINLGIVSQGILQNYI